MSETSPAVPECVVLIGLPGAGKTSFYRERFAGTHDHVSKDLLRNNRKPSRRQELLIDDALGRGRSVVIDNVHAQASTRAPAIAAARRHHAEVVAYFFPVAVADALRRNRARAGRARVPDVAIFAARKRFELPRLDEGFDRLFIVDLDEQEGRFVVRPDQPVTAGVYRS
jgi:predicted kinase